MLWAAAADLALAQGDAAEALRIVDGLYAAAANLTAEADIPRLALLKARALTELGEDEPAVDLLRAAQATAHAVGARAMLWQLHAALAGLFRSQGQRDAAAGEVAAAETIIRDLANTLPDATRREEYLSAALAHLAAEAGIRPRRRTGELPGGLTRREMDVARLIADGRTNREIATTLFVSERTVETHASNILRRLGFNSRTQIAAWVATLPPDHRDT